MAKKKKNGLPKKPQDQISAFYLPGWLDRGSPADPTIPNQFWSLNGRDESNPEKDFCIAMLAAVVEDIRLKSRARDIASAIQWVESRANDPGSFVYVCEVLDFEPTYLRRGLWKILETKREIKIRRKYTSRSRRIEGISN